MLVPAREPETLKVFVSYSRHDAQIADAFVEKLTARGFEVAIDRRDLPFGEKWQTELADFIRLSDTVVWLISEGSIQSKWVNWELDEVAKRNKRLVPVMVSNTAVETLPRQLGEIHILPAEGVFDFGRDLDALVTVLENDRAWLKQASRLQDRASEWLSKARTSALLLSRGALTEAERWKENRPTKAPSPAPEVLDLLLASRQAVTRRQRWWVGGSLIVMVGALALAGLAEYERAAAVVSKNDALTRESYFRAEQTKQAGADAVTASLLALEGLPDSTSADDDQRTRPFVNEPWSALYAARPEIRERTILSGHTGGVTSATFASGGDRILTASTWDGTARLWDSDGKPRAILPAKEAIFSPDGDRILTASGNTARLWDRDGRPLTTLSGHTDRVTSVVFSRDGGRILTASNDKTARLWDRDGTPLATPMMHEGVVTRAVFSRDGSRILTESYYDKKARLWDLDGKLLSTLTDHSERGADFSPDGRVLTVSENTAQLWDGGGKLLATLTGHTQQVISAVFSPTGDRILTASQDHTARLWDRDGNALATLTGHTDPIVSAVFSPDGKTILTASGNPYRYGVGDNTARLWNRDGKPLATFAGHAGALTSAVFSPDGSRILTASNDGTARLWDVNRALPILTIGEGFGDEQDIMVAMLDNGGGLLSARAVFAPDGSRILTSAVMSKPKLWDRGGKQLAILDDDSGFVLSIAFSPDGDRILTVSEETARLWDRDGKPIATLKGHKDNVYNALFSPDGDRILTASQDDTARLWDRDGKLIAVLEGHKSSVVSAVFSLDGNRILTASADNTARLWDRDGKPLVVLGEEKLSYGEWTRCAVFSPDGSRILTANTDETVRLWDGDGKLLASLKGHKGAVTSAVFSRDSSRILTASLDNTARLWDRDGKPLTAFEGHMDAVNSAVFAPDGNRVLTASNDHTARLWDQDGKPLATLLGHTGGVESAVFAPEGSQIMTASLDGTVRLWEDFPTSEALIERIKAEVPRCLTQEQRQLYALGPTSPRWCATMQKWPEAAASNCEKPGDTPQAREFLRYAVPKC